MEVSFKEKIKDFFKAKKKSIVFFLALFLSGALLWSLYATYAATGLGVAYDWKTGESLNDFTPVNVMPEGWDFVTFGSYFEDGSYETFGIWVPIGNPMVASRELKLGDKGDDVIALQTTLNYIKTDDASDYYYFENLETSGFFDTATQAAIKKLQEFYGLEATGIADLNVQSSIYQQATNAGE